MTYKSLLVHLKDHVAIVRMNRPESMNSLEYELRVDLVNCLKKFSEDEDVRVIILTGCSNVFSAGGDLRELGEGMPADRARKYVLHVSRIVEAIVNLEKPVIAAVNGAAVGASFSMVMACDIIVASEKATFSQAFVDVGLIPDLGGTFFSPRLFGLHRAKESVFTGKTFDANELADIGMINHVVPHDDLEQKAFDLAREIAQKPHTAIALAKKLLNIGLHSNLHDILEMEAQAQAVCMQTKDHMEAIAAFYEKKRTRAIDK
ncbi:MAG: enoyl-CoA hydratase/isomerase family protein [Desulfobacteraceae bacterium]|nr:enoyl-CoA hydratase/isomerase family protein [Desulfobacteraceae bacterium]